MLVHRGGRLGGAGPDSGGAGARGLGGGRAAGQHAARYGARASLAASGAGPTQRRAPAAARLCAGTTHAHYTLHTRRPTQ